MMKVANFLFWGLVFTFTTLCGEQWAPDYLIIGAQKSGTTALYHFLNQHPMVVKKMEETHYFDRNFEKSIHWYKEQFPKRAKAGDLIGDKSPYYFFHPLVPERVFRFYPDIKIVVILRNPVNRAYSQYWHNIRNQVEVLSFSDAIANEELRLEGEYDKLVNDPFYSSYNYPKFSYQERGKYAIQLERWLKYFKADQILVLTNEELRSDPIKTMNKVFDFLGIYPLYEMPPFVETHEPYPPMDSMMRQHLTEKFRPYNESLENLLNRKFNW